MVRTVPMASTSGRPMSAGASTPMAPSSLSRRLLMGLWLCLGVGVELGLGLGSRGRGGVEAAVGLGLIRGGDRVGAGRSRLPSALGTTKGCLAISPGEMSETATCSSLLATKVGGAPT